LVCIDSNGMILGQHRIQKSISVKGIYLHFKNRFEVEKNPNISDCLIWFHLHLFSQELVQRRTTKLMEVVSIYMGLRKG